MTRQSYYQHFWQQEAVGFEQELVLKEVLRIRYVHRRMGGRKLYELLEPSCLNIRLRWEEMLFLIS
ncbi:MAG: hypothetical protein AAFY41_08875 [Bacteroidota bacterium]